MEIAHKRNFSQIYIAGYAGVYEISRHNRRVSVKSIAIIRLYANLNNLIWNDILWNDIYPKMKQALQRDTGIQSGTTKTKS